MAANEYLSYREWCAAVEKLCVDRLHQSLTMIPELTVKDMEEAHEDGATPEEFYETDVHDAMALQNAKRRTIT